MKFFFKKYLEFEEKHGDETLVAEVKQKALDYVESQGYIDDWWYFHILHAGFRYQHMILFLISQENTIYILNIWTDSLIRIYTVILSDFRHITM